MFIDIEYTVLCILQFRINKTYYTLKENLNLVQKPQYKVTPIGTLMGGVPCFKVTHLILLLSILCGY